MPVASRILTCAIGLTLGGWLVVGFAGGQDGPPGEKGKGKKEKRDKDGGEPKGEKNTSEREAKAVVKFAERAMKAGEGMSAEVADKIRRDAEELFRRLDRDGSGFLEPAEWTDGLLTAGRSADADGDGRIDFAEYRRYLDGRVSVVIETGPPPKPEKPEKFDKPEKQDRVEKPGKGEIQPLAGGTQPSKSREPVEEPKPVAIRAGHLPPGLPRWFEEFDADRDAQVALHEWLRAGKPIEEFEAMDLDGDGLLPPDELLRYLRVAARTEATAATEEAQPTKPGKRK